MKLRLKLSLFKLALFSRIRKKMMGPFVKGVLCETKNGFLVIGAEDLEVGKKLAFHGDYELNTLDEISRCIDQKSSVCIIGGHVGSLVIPLSKIARSIEVFEPHPENFQMLNFNLKINDIHNVTTHNVAVGNKFGKINFLKNRVNSGGSKIQPKVKEYIYYSDHPEMIRVDMVPFDDFFKESPAFDLILMDIEGAEYMAMTKMQEALKQCQYLQVEYVPHHLKNVASVTNEMFLAQFSGYFSYGKILGEKADFEQSEFKNMLDHLYDNGRCVDLLFSKDPFE